MRRAISQLWLTRLAEWDRRRRADSALAREVARDAPAIFEEVTRDLVADGRARLEIRWDDVVGGEMLVLIPADPDAAPVAMSPHARGVDLWAGPDENLHEIAAGAGTDWRRQLRDCLEAVVAGRYAEAIMPWARGRELRMVFETPAETIIVWHLGRCAGPVGERRFAAYRAPGG